MKSNHLLSITAATALLLSALNVSATEQSIGRQDYLAISGAGSTFIAPLVKQWIEDYQKGQHQL